MSGKTRLALHYFIALLTVVTLLLGTLGPLSVQAARAQALGTHTPAQTAALDPLANGSIKIQQYSPVSDGAGWILMDARLYWTKDAGTNWSEITPALPSGAIIYDVKFMDTKRGQVLYTNNNTDGDLLIQLASTTDGGDQWATAPVQTLVPDDPNADLENAWLDWVDENNGWVSTKTRTGVNFSSGILFRTTDGGRSWQRSSPPISAAVHFISSLTGWMVGGPAGNQLFKTQDGGANWQAQIISASLNDRRNVTIYPPVFASPESGMVAVTSSEGNDLLIDFFSTHDGGQTWSQTGSLPLGALVGNLALSGVDGQDLVIAVPNSHQIIQIVQAEVKTISNQDGRSAGLVDLAMLTLDSGWARWNVANCDKQAVTGTPGALNIVCESKTQLLKTEDGGLTWETILLPGVGAEILDQSTTTSSFSGLPGNGFTSQANTMTFIGQGFDGCEIPSLSHLQAWWNGSPYQVVNLYIGGSLRACANNALSASYVNQMRAQGWSFIPTWVGPQAPCTNYSDKISYDVDTAYAQGVDEANLAVDRLSALGLTAADKSGSAVYYDMESYGTASDCRNAVNSFMNGWVYRLHTRGNLAGAYASTLCNQGLNDFLTIANVPDLAWPARWYHNAGSGSYDPTASVWNVGSCIPSTAWSDHQRIRQYEGGHNESWGGVTLNIDNDVLDGVVAVPNILGFNKYNPLNGAANLPASLTLAWGASSSPDSYWYCYAKTNPCTNWISNGTSTSVVLSGLSPNTTYYWHVKAVNALGTTYANGDINAVWSFTTAGLPGSFGKSLPANGASITPPSLTLTWGASSNSYVYYYCYATTNPCTNWVSNGHSTSATISGLSTNATYYWHVRAVNSFGSLYSDGGSTTTWWFTTASAPGAFNKTGPASGAVNQPVNPTLFWGASSGATGYYYCRSKSSTSCTNWVSSGAATSVVLSGLAPSTTYYWQVRAVNSFGTTYANGGSQKFWSFKTGAKPSAFNKTAPAAGATKQSLSPRLSWGSSFGTVTYYYCISPTKPCASWVSNGLSRSVYLSGLSLNTIYYWQVKAVNSFGTTYANGSSGAFWSFKTRAK